MCIRDSLNRIPSKIVIKTPYELWTGKSPNIRHLHVWSCPANARPYILHEKKLNSRTVSCFFVAYSGRYKSFRFYCPSTKNIIETDNAKLFFLRIFRTVRVNYIRISHEEEHIVILMTTIPNDEVLAPLQNENIVVPFKVQIQFILK